MPTPNPYQAPEAPLGNPPPTTREDIWRARYVTLMWVCGVAGTFTITPMVSALAPGRPVTIGMYLAALPPFLCGIASMVTALLLFQLGRIADRLGAIACIVTVGIWPPLLAGLVWVDLLSR
jgi:hypothetical protein